MEKGPWVEQESSPEPISAKPRGVFFGVFLLQSTQNLTGGFAVILVLGKGITKEEVQRLKDMLRSEGHMVKEIGGAEERVLGIVGKMYRESEYYESLPGVEK